MLEVEHRGDPTEGDNLDSYIDQLAGWFRDNIPSASTVTLRGTNIMRRG